MSGSKRQKGKNMAYKKNKKKPKMYRGKKKYSYNERLTYHASKSSNIWHGANSAEEALSLFKRKDFAYSQGYVDAATGSEQHSSVTKYGGNIKAYEAGVNKAYKDKEKSYHLKF